MKITGDLQTHAVHLVASQQVEYGFGRLESPNNKELSCHKLSDHNSIVVSRR